MKKKFYRHSKTTHERVGNLAARISVKLGRYVGSRELRKFAEDRGYFPAQINHRGVFPIGTADDLFTKFVDTDALVRNQWLCMARTRAEQTPRLGAFMESAAIEIDHGEKTITLPVGTPSVAEWFNQRLAVSINNELRSRTGMPYTIRLSVKPQPEAAATPPLAETAEKPADELFHDEPKETPEEMRRNIEKAKERQQFEVVAQKLARLIGKMPLDIIVTELQQRGYEVTLHKPLPNK